MVEDKVALSSLESALPVLSMSSALALPEVALTLVEVVVPVEMTLDPMAASLFTLMMAMIATTPMLRTMLDFPVYKLSEEELVASASLVPSLPLARLALKLLSASLIPVMALVLLLPSMSRLVVRLSLVRRLVMSALVVTLVPSAVLILLITARLLVRRFALVDVWVEELVLVESVSVTMASRAQTVLLKLK